MEVNVLWKGKYMSVVSPEKYPYEAVLEPNGIGVLAIINVNGVERFIVRKELVPPYTIRGGDKMFYTVLGGGSNDGEKPNDTLLRELREESGIIVKSYSILWTKTMPIVKVSASRGSFYIIRINTYDIEKPKGDGTTYEKVAKTLFVTERRLNEIVEGDDVDFLLVGLVSKYKTLLKKQRKVGLIREYGDDSFLIDGTGKVWRAKDLQPKGLHGNIIWHKRDLLLKVQKKLVQMFPDYDTASLDYELKKAIGNGSDWLYKVLYDNGCIRGTLGDSPFVAYNAHVTSSAKSALMDMLSGIESSEIDVEYDGKWYDYVPLGKFIHKFL